jgi:hypothetical protein
LSKSLKLSTIISQADESISGCERLCRTKFELYEEKAKNYLLMKDVEKYKQDTLSLFKQLSLVFALNLYIDRMKDLPLVESIYIVKKENISDIWTIIRENNLKEEKKIADAQCELMRIHQELDFDFMVIPRFERETKDLLPAGSKQVYPTNELW